MKSLIDHLAQAYPGRYRQEYREGNTEFVFKIDDESEGDPSPDFCQIYATIKSPSTFELHLANCPMTTELTEFVESSGSTIVESSIGKDVRLDLSVKQVGAIRELAQIIRRIIGRGHRYPNPQWKWVCRRTACALDRFADELTEYRHISRHAAGAQLESTSHATNAPVSASSTPARQNHPHATTDASDEPNLFEIFGHE